MADERKDKNGKGNDTEFPLLKDDSAPDVSKPLPENSQNAPNGDHSEASRVTFADRIAEEQPEPIQVPRSRLRNLSRRDFILYGASVVAAGVGFWWVLPEETQQRLFTDAQRAKLDSLEARVGLSAAHSAQRKDRLLNGSLTFDDDVAEALYSPNRTVPTYAKHQITPNLRNNYDGQTPDPAYIPEWTLAVVGLASGHIERLKIGDLLHGFQHHDQVTRLVCVEGWSAIAGWGGVRFADFLKAYPPAPGAKWARLDSAVNLDGDGNPDPYYVSIDLETARHPQTLLATHQNDLPLSVEHGAPLRLIAPMKLGLKNIKAITKITYTQKQPGDYWNERGYSKYDGL